jgi:hypothetical protein
MKFIAPNFTKLIMNPQMFLDIFCTHFLPYKMKNVKYWHNLI